LQQSIKCRSQLIEQKLQSWGYYCLWISPNIDYSVYFISQCNTTTSIASGFSRLLWHALSQSVSLLLACTSEAYCRLAELLFDLSYMRAQSWLVFQNPWPMSQRERNSYLSLSLYMRFNCSTPGAVEMADWWFKDGWRQWLKEGYSLQHSNGVLLFYTSVTSRHHPQNLSYFSCLISHQNYILNQALAYLTVSILIGARFLGKFLCLNLICSMHPWTTREMQENLVQPLVRWAQVISCDDDRDLREKHRHKFLISMSWLSKTVRISRCVYPHSDELEEGILKEHSVQSCLGWRLVQMDNIFCSVGRS